MRTVTLGMGDERRDVTIGGRDIELLVDHDGFFISGGAWLRQDRKESRPWQGARHRRPRS
jgi:hypothetical protein